MGTFFIVSVGTSLIGKHNENCEKHKSVHVRETNWKHSSGRYERYLSEFINEKGENSLQDISAELSSLLRDETLRPEKDDSILLLHTDTKAAGSCAKHIKNALGKLGITDVRPRKVDKLSEATAHDFYDQGLPNLLTCLYERVIFQIDLSTDQEYKDAPEGKKDPKDLLKSMSEEYEISEKINGSGCKIVRKTWENAGIVFEY